MTIQQPPARNALASLMSGVLCSLMAVALAGPAQALQAQARTKWSPRPATPVVLAPYGDNLSSEARAINRWGEVAGVSYDDLPVATVWDADGTAWPLPALEGGSGSRAFAINAWGEAAGESLGAATSAVRWSRRGEAMRLAPPEGDHESFARGINAWGAVAGYSAGRNDADGNGTLLRAVRWNPAGEPTVLPPLPGDSEAMALAINDRGLVVGYSFSAESGDTAVVWDRSGGPTALSLPDGQLGEAQAINRRGTVAGDGEVAADRATLWPARARPVALASLDSDPEHHAFAINGGGAAAGVSISEELFHTAVLWRRGAQPTALPALPGQESWAWGLNDRGDVVGFSAGETGTTAVLWRASPAPRHGKKRTRYRRFSH